MLESLQIKGFRCFSEFHIAGFARLNLISGKNSSGKSTLLDAIHFVVHPSAESLLELLEWRDQVPHEPRASWTEDLVRPLFHVDSPLHFELTSAPREVSCRVAMQTRTLDGQWVEQGMDTESSFRKPVLVIEVSKAKAQFVVAVDGTIELTGENVQRASFRFLRHNRFDHDRLIYLRPSSFTSTRLADMLEDILGTPRQDDLLRILQWAVPGARHLFTKGQGEARSIWVQTVELPPQPLAAFGDGATRLVGIGLTLTLAKGGYCLIDEIENGIHYSLFPDLWNLLGRFSRELDVQVFATTHSKDCLDAFEEYAAKEPGDAAYFRLERDPQGRIEAVRLDYENYFSRVAGLAHEVR